ALEGIEWRARPGEESAEDQGAENHEEGNSSAAWVPAWLGSRQDSILHHAGLGLHANHGDDRGEWDEFSPEEAGHVRQTNITLVVDGADPRNLGHHDYYDHMGEEHDHHH